MREIREWDAIVRSCSTNSEENEGRSQFPIRNEVLPAHLVGNAETPAGFEVKRARDPRKGAKRLKGGAARPGSINRRLIASLSMSSRCIGA